MAVNTIYMRGAYDPATRAPPESYYAGASSRLLLSRAIVPAGASAGSKIYFGRIRSLAMLDLTRSWWATAGIAGLTDFDLGLEGIDLRARAPLSDPDCLVDGDDLSAATRQTIFGHGTIVTSAYRVPIFGATSLFSSNTAPPEFDVIGTLNTDASGSPSGDNLLEDTGTLASWTGAATATVNAGGGPSGGDSITVADDDAAATEEKREPVNTVIAAGDVLHISWDFKADGAALTYPEWRLANTADLSQRVDMAFRLTAPALTVSVVGASFEVVGTPVVENITGAWWRASVIVRVLAGMIFRWSLFPAQRPDADWPLTAAVNAAVGSVELSGPIIRKGGAGAIILNLRYGIG